MEPTAPLAAHVDPSVSEAPYFETPEEPPMNAIVRLSLEDVVPRHRPLVDGSRGADIRLRVAKGLLPSSLEDLIPTLTYLLRDDDATVREAAAKTLREF